MKKETIENKEDKDIKATEKTKNAKNKAEEFREEQKEEQKEIKVNISLITIILIVVIIIVSILSYFRYSSIKSKSSNMSNKNQNLINAYTEYVENEKYIDPENIEEMKSDNVKRDDSKIKITIKEDSITNKGMKIKIEDTNENPYKYDSWFQLEKLENDDWKTVDILEDTKDEEFVFEIYNDVKDGIIEETINWENIYGRLEKGKYKLIKRYMDGDFYYTINKEFEIK